MNRRRWIAAIWIGVLLSGLAAVGQEATPPLEPLEHPTARQRRDIHAALPGDANTQDLLRADESLDASCPCRGAFVDEESSGYSRSDPADRPALLLGSAILVLAAMFTGWQICRRRG